MPRRSRATGRRTARAPRSCPLGPASTPNRRAIETSLATPAQAVLRRITDMKAATATCIAAAMTIGAALLSSTAMVHAQDQAKPNILVIMGDDVGWFNIGAYHRGIMSGKTPNLDKLAVGGHDVHRLLCRSELHGGPGELHHRRNSVAHRLDDRRPGRRGRRHAGQGRDHRRRPQGSRVRHRPVRQEPSRRSEQVPADTARLRRVLRLPLSPRRDVGSLLVFVPE